jgi:hypothetical protein
MARLTRTASLTAGALLLLAWIGTASGECAWVLWEHSATSDRGSGRTSEPVEAHGSEARCLDAMSDRVRLVVARLKNAGYRITWQGRDGVTAQDDARKMAVARGLQCWPDTIDPRGSQK